MPNYSDRSVHKKYGITKGLGPAVDGVQTNPIDKLRKRSAPTPFCLLLHKRGRGPPM